MCIVLKILISCRLMNSHLVVDVRVKEDRTKDSQLRVVVGSSGARVGP